MSHSGGIIQSKSWKYLICSLNGIETIIWANCHNWDLNTGRLFSQGKENSGDPAQFVNSGQLCSTSECRGF